MPLNQDLFLIEESQEHYEECYVDSETLALHPAPKYGDIWERIRMGYGLPHKEKARIDRHLRWYANNQRYMTRVTERAKPYLFHIVEQLEHHQLPMELALLPIVESAFDPFAYSHGRASGIWQFIPSTGRNYGLKQNWWYDGRRDIEASTRAAIKYLSRLHTQFKGDWLLALAAYNTGEGNVARAIRRNRQAGKATDFWSLKLPRETRAYVPQLLAISKLVQDPDYYGLSLSPIEDRPYFQRVDLDFQLDLAQASEMAEMSMDELYLLNPGYNRWATEPSGVQHLLLPLEKIEPFNQRLQEVPLDQRVAWERYKVRRGDTLSGIAKKFRTDVRALKTNNGIRSSTIRVGQALLIPVATRPDQHYVRSADQRLRLTQSRSKGKPGSRKISYMVEPGDSFWKIAQAHKTTVRDLAKWNGMAPKDPLKAGQRLVVWSKAATNTPPQSKNKGIIRKVAYRVRRGDSLSRIASKFNLSIKDIQSWNTVNTRKYLQPGQSLTLFVDITKAN